MTGRGRTCFARPKTQILRPQEEQTVEKLFSLFNWLDYRSKIAVVTIPVDSVCGVFYISATFISTCPLHIKNKYKLLVGAGKERCTLLLNWSMEACKVKAAPIIAGTTLTDEDYWPCTSGLSAVNAIGTQLLRGSINSGLHDDPLWRTFGGIKKHQIQPE